MKETSINVLVIEDDLSLQKSLSDMLIDHVGVARVTCTESVHDFKKYVKTEKQRAIHLIILDGLVGIELLRWIKEDQNLNSIPVLIVTGNVDSSEMKEAKELGADAYMKKPADLNILRYVIQELPMFKTLLCLV